MNYKFVKDKDVTYLFYDISGTPNKWLWDSSSHGNATITKNNGLKLTGDTTNHYIYPNVTFNSGTCIEFDIVDYQVTSLDDDIHFHIYGSGGGLGYRSLNQLSTQVGSHIKITYIGNTCIWYTDGVQRHSGTGTVSTIAFRINSANTSTITIKNFLMYELRKR